MIHYNNEHKLEPAVVIWVKPNDISKMKDGILPLSWKLENPNKLLEDKYKFVQIIVPSKYFENILIIREELNNNTGDLPF